MNWPLISSYEKTYPYELSDKLAFPYMVCHLLEDVRAPTEEAVAQRSQFLGTGNARYKPSQTIGCK